MLLFTLGTLATGASLALGHPTAAPTVAKEALPCLAQSHPTNKTHYPVECMVADRSKRAYRAPKTAPVVPSSAAPPLLVSNGGSSSMFDFIQSFPCQSASSRADYCTQVISTFNRAGQILSGIFDIKTRIKVNLMIKPYCNGAGGACSPGETPGALGNAGPSRLLPLVSDDGQTRYYPQALVKQILSAADLASFSLETYDINVHINSRDIDHGPGFTKNRLYFQGDKLPAATNDPVYDVLGTVLHELLHGLGFASMWSRSSYNGKDIYLPSVISFGNEGAGSLTENIYDRFIRYNTPPTKTSRSDIVNYANSVLFPNDNSRLPAANNAFLKQSPVVVDLLSSMAALSTSSKSLTFNTRAGNLDLFIETHLNPYKPGSSCNHLDADTYRETPEFLMIYQSASSTTVAQHIAKTNGLLPANKLNDVIALQKIDMRRAVGPGTVAIMQSMGWTVKTGTGYTDYKTGAYPPTTNAAPNPTANTPVALPQPNPNTNKPVTYSADRKSYYDPILDLWIGTSGSRVKARQAPDGVYNTVEDVEDNVPYFDNELVEFPDPDEWEEEEAEMTGAASPGASQKAKRFAPKAKADESAW